MTERKKENLTNAIQLWFEKYSSVSYVTSLVIPLYNMAYLLRDYFYLLNHSSQQVILSPDL